MKSVNVLLQQVKRITLLSDSTTLIYISYGLTTSAWPTSFHNSGICCLPCLPVRFPKQQHVKLLRTGIQYKTK
jgi:uncharacterized protein (DUF779 family)